MYNSSQEDVVPLEKAAASVESEEDDGVHSPLDSSDSDDSNPISYSASNNSPSVMSGAEELDKQEVNARLSIISEVRDEPEGYAEKVTPEIRRATLGSEVIPDVRLSTLESDYHHSIPEPEACRTCPILLDSISELESRSQKMQKLVDNVCAS
jgi:hypothetical protein